MAPLQTLALLLGSSFASGLNLYATVATLGLLHRFGVLHLPQQLQTLAHPVVLGIALALYVLEFIADKIPWFDSVWDVIHTFIRPPAAALLAYAAVGGAPEPWRIAAGLLAGTVAFTSHGAKASTRAAVNTSPEPFSNWLLSLTEDGVAVFLVWLATAHPILTICLVTILAGASLFVIVKFFGFLQRALRRFFAGQPASRPA